MFRSPNLQVGKEATDIYIPSNASFQTLIDSLKQKDAIGNVTSFAFLAKMLGYQEKVKSGKYRLQKNMNNYDALRMLRAGSQTPVKLTFNHIRLQSDFNKRIAKDFAFSEEELQSHLDNPATAEKYGFKPQTILCMFLPNTYELYWTTSPEKFVERMHQEYQRFWTEERKQKAKKLGLSPIEVSILASIVDSETNKNEEKARIAGLYINRLEENMYLQADPTVKFALGNFELKRVLYRDLEVESPYNTYLNKGLPPGPISMPSLATIDAVLNYEKHDFFYFCAKEDFSGYHRFAKDKTEHDKNARLLHKALDMRGY